MARSRARPKAERDWRWFVAEYAVVFAGVLTALGAQQVAETLSHRQQANEARQGLRAELGFNLASFDLMVSQMPCANRRLDELDRWRQSWQEGAPLKLVRPVGGPSLRIFRTSVWKVASAEGVAHMPFRERVAFGQFYDGLENNGDLRQQISALWRELGQYDLTSELNRGEVVQMGRSVTRLRQLNLAVGSNATSIQGYAREVGVVALKVPDSPRGAARARDLCRPMLQES